MPPDAETVKQLQQMVESASQRMEAAWNDAETLRTANTEAMEKLAAAVAAVEHSKRALAATKEAAAAAAADASKAAAAERQTSQAKVTKVCCHAKASIELKQPIPCATRSLASTQPINGPLA